MSVYHYFAPIGLGRGNIFGYNHDVPTGLEEGEPQGPSLHLIRSLIKGTEPSNSFVCERDSTISFVRM